MKNILLLSLLISTAQSANILGMFKSLHESHNVLGSILLGNLAKRGHNVTYINAFKSTATHPNFTQLVVDEELTVKKERFQQFLRANKSLLDNFRRLIVGFDTHDAFLENPKIQWLLKSDSTFDLIITHNIWAGFDSTIGFAHHFDAPVILFVSFGGFSLIDDEFGNPRPPAYVPNAHVAFSDEMHFWQRLGNTLVGLTFTALSPIFAYFANIRLQRHFPGAPSVDELQRHRIPMAFINSHFSTETPRPYVPAMVQIGGFHLQEPEPLPEELKAIVDEATNGVIYFSLGTNVKIEDIAEDKLDILMKSLGQLPLKILMKSGNATLVNKPENVEIRSWFPQRGVLSHPNVKLFITHGGLGGRTESLYYGVPMICIPFFSDQPKNCADVEHDGYGINLPLNQLTPETFGESLRKVLYDEKLIASTKLKSELYRDQEMNPMDRAAYWVDHVIKHKGAKHLRVKALDLAWYQYYLLDVIAFILSVVFIVCLVSYYILKWCFNKICRSRRHGKIKTN